MYTGRILSSGMNSDGKPFVAYRVSSRSFPNRRCLGFDDSASIVPKEGFENDIYKSPYIAYNSVCIVDDKAVDDYNTPRIAAVVTANAEEDKYECYIGIVNDKKILVEEVPFGEASFISTYGSQVPDKVDFEAKTSAEAAKYIFDEGVFANYEKPVTSCAAVFDGEWTIDVYNP